MDDKENTVPVWNANFMLCLKRKENMAAYLGTGNLVSQTPWKTETRTKYLNIFCAGRHILSQLCDKVFYSVKGMYIKPNDLLGKTCLHSSKDCANSTWKKSLWPLRAHWTIPMYPDSLQHFTLLPTLKFQDKHTIVHSKQLATTFK